MSPRSEWICKRCGSDDIVAEVEIYSPADVGGRIRERNGKPYFDEDDLDLSFPEHDVIAYVCECGESASSIEKLVVRRRAFAEMQLPCGRCDHTAKDHPQVGSHPAREGFTRPPMPCTVPGCDCHDYYDVALGIEPNWDRPQQEVLVA